MKIVQMLNFLLQKYPAEDWRYGILSTFVLLILVIINIVA